MFCSLLGILLDVTCNHALNKASLEKPRLYLERQLCQRLMYLKSLEI